MARHIPSTRHQESVPARAPAFRAQPSNQPAQKAPDAATIRRYPRAPGVRGDKDPVTPVLAPALHVRDLPPRWYGIGGTG